MPTPTATSKNTCKKRPIGSCGNPVRADASEPYCHLHPGGRGGGTGGPSAADASWVSAVPPPASAPTPPGGVEARDQEATSRVRAEYADRFRGPRVPDAAPSPAEPAVETRSPEDRLLDHYADLGGMSRDEVDTHPETQSLLGRTAKDYAYGRLRALNLAGIATDAERVEFEAYPPHFDASATAPAPETEPAPVAEKPTFGRPVSPASDDLARRVFSDPAAASAVVAATHWSDSDIADVFADLGRSYGGDRVADLAVEDLDAVLANSEVVPALARSLGASELDVADSLNGVRRYLSNDEVRRATETNRLRLRYIELDETAKAVKREQDAIKERFRELPTPSGRKEEYAIGDGTISVTPGFTFDADLAAARLSPEDQASITRTYLDATVARAVLTPDDLEKCLKPKTPSISVK